MRLHVLGLPHTRTTNHFSHCAYTGKVRRFAQMMQPLGYEVIHYGVSAPDSPGWAEHVEVLSPEEQVRILGFDPQVPSPEFVGRSTHVQSPLFREFNARLQPILQDRVHGDDIICATFGHGHQEGFRGLEQYVVETGIGYPTCVVGYRIYESYAWLHWHLGRDQRHAWMSEWVVPNYFDVAEWPVRSDWPKRGAYVLYFGRITKEKGVDVVWQLARARPDLQFVLCGQGDAGPWLKDTPNLTYHAPVAGMERARMFHKARVVLMPTAYLEPFGGVAVEAMLTGTPVLASDQGAFAETMDPAFRCHTFGDWLAGLDHAEKVANLQLRERAISRYSLEAVGPQYDRIFQQIPEMRVRGWAAGGPPDGEHAHGGHLN